MKKNTLMQAHTISRHVLDEAFEKEKVYPPQPIDLLENLFHMKTDNKFSSVVILLSSFFTCLFLVSRSQYNTKKKLHMYLVGLLLVTRSLCNLIHFCEKKSNIFVDSCAVSLQKKYKFQCFQWNQNVLNLHEVCQYLSLDFKSQSFCSCQHIAANCKLLYILCCSDEVIHVKWIWGGFFSITDAMCELHAETGRICIKFN